VSTHVLVAFEDLRSGVVGLKMQEELFKEVDLPGRGTGLVASCDLQPGVLLLAEPPLLTVPWWQRLTQFNRNRERSDLLSKQLLGLTKEKQEGFWRLADCKVKFLSSIEKYESI